MGSDWRYRIVADASDRDAWLRTRKAYVTASDVPAILGLDTKSSAAVLRDKLSKEVAPELHLAQIEAGRYLERGILDWYLADQLPDDDLHRGNALVCSPEYPWLAATPDAVLVGEPIEVKCAMWSSRPNWHADTRSLKGWPRGFRYPRAVDYWVKAPPLVRQPKKPDHAGMWRASTRYQLTELLPKFGPPEAPLKYWVQLQMQMHVLGAERGVITALQGGTTRYDLTYLVDYAFQSWMLERLTTFRKEWVNRL